MKNITLIFMILLATAMVGCSKQQPQPQFQPQPVVPVQPAQPPKPEVGPVTPPTPSPPQIHHSAAWINGYNDGYTGAWLGPVSWLVSNEYRSGWDAGNSDLKQGKPHRIHD